MRVIHTLHTKSEMDIFLYDKNANDIISSYHVFYKEVKFLSFSLQRKQHHYHHVFWLKIANHGHTTRKKIADTFQQKLQFHTSKDHGEIYGEAGKWR